jgi:hypothetical protein
MNNQARVGEIYSTAGNAFKLLGELTSQMESAHESTRTSSDISTRWTNREIEMLQRAVGNFAAQLNHISQEIKTRAVDQVPKIYISVEKALIFFKSSYLKELGNIEYGNIEKNTREPNFKIPQYQFRWEVQNTSLPVCQELGKIPQYLFVEK